MSTHRDQVHTQLLAVLDDAVGNILFSAGMNVPVNDYPGWE
jgi:hypothetical protein